MITIPMQVSADTQTIPVSVNADPALSLTIGAAYEMVDADPYTGATEFTPSSVTQTVLTAGKYLSHNITINPVPDHYGLITWNGSFLTVS